MVGVATAATRVTNARAETTLNCILFDFCVILNEHWELFE